VVDCLELPSPRIPFNTLNTLSDLCDVWKVSWSVPPLVPQARKLFCFRRKRPSRYALKLFCFRGKRPSRYAIKLFCFRRKRPSRYALKLFCFRRKRPSRYALKLFCFRRKRPSRYAQTLKGFRGPGHLEAPPAPILCIAPLRQDPKKYRVLYLDATHTVDTLDLFKLHREGNLFVETEKVDLERLLL